MLRFRMLLSRFFHEHLRPSELGVMSSVLHRKWIPLQVVPATASPFAATFSVTSSSSCVSTQNDHVAAQRAKYG